VDSLTRDCLTALLGGYDVGLWPAGRQTFCKRDLWLTRDHSVGKLSAMGLPTIGQLSLLFTRGR